VLTLSNGMFGVLQAVTLDEFLQEAQQVLQDRGLL